ncbi:EamA/RhaT family transporter [Acidobacteria bacterium ACD]|nr:EamA/RhaT family transporter [Acidobacteria bacterium ACD]
MSVHSICEDRSGRLLVMAAALLWSTGGLAIKLVPLAGLGVVFWRSAVTFLFLAVVLRPSLARLKTASPASVVVYALMILSFVSATKMTTAANAIFLQYTGPLYVLLLSPVVLKEPFRKADAVAIVAALSGMSLFFVGRLEPGALAGNLMAVASGVFFGGVVLLLRRGAGGDALPSMVLGNLLAALVALPFAWGGLALDGKGLLLVTYLGVVQMGVAYLLFVRGLTVVPAAEASLLGMLEPLFNPVWAFVGIGERPSPWALAGGAVVLLSVAARTLWASRAAR